MAEPFVPENFEAPSELMLPGMRLEPLGPEHNERDHETWSSSIDHIRATPGFSEGNWPRPMSLEENLGDLQRHAADFAARRGFTYSVLDPDSDEVIGCVYIYPSKDEGYDAQVESWVRASRAELDTALWRGVSEWLDADWPFSRVDYRST